MKIFLFEFKQRHDGRVFDSPFNEEMVFQVPAQIQHLQLKKIIYPNYVLVNVYGTDRREGRK